MANTSGEKQKRNQMFSLTLFLLTDPLCRKMEGFSGGHTHIDGADGASK